MDAGRVGAGVQSRDTDIRGCVEVGERVDHSCLSVALGGGGYAVDI